MRRNGGDQGARGGVRDGMARAGRTGAALFMMHSSFSTAASSWMMTPPPFEAFGGGGVGVFGGDGESAAQIMQIPANLPPPSPVLMRGCRDARASGLS